MENRDLEPGERLNVAVSSAEAKLSSWWNAISKLPEDFSPHEFWGATEMTPARFREFWMDLGQSGRDDFQGAVCVFPHVLLRESEDFLEEASCAAVNRATSSLEECLADLLEQYNGASAALYVLHGNCLVPQITLNRRPNGGVHNVHYVGDKNSPVSQAFESGEYSASDALAVSLVSFEGKRLGVFLIEAQSTVEYSPMHLRDLQIACKRAVADVIILSFLTELRGMSPLSFAITPVGWHPSVHGWTSTRILKDYCRKVSLALERHYGTGDSSFGSVDFSCVVWECDWESRHLWAKANYNYDHEYLAGKRLGVNSFTGRAISSDQGKGDVVSGQACDLVRCDKAERASVSSFYVIPFLGDSLQVENDHQLKKAMGAFNVYVKSGASHEPSISDILLKNLAITVENILEMHRRLRCQVGVATLVDRISNCPRAISSSVSVCLDAIMEIVDADAGSIFALRGDDLICVATSGIEFEGCDAFDLESIRYDLRVPEDQGFTTLLGKTPGLLIRKNDIANDTDPLICKGFDGGLLDNPVRSRMKFREKAVAFDPHSRFLGISLRSSSGLSSGVIRLLRNSCSPPFGVEDEDLLRHLAGVAATVIDSNKTERRRLPRSLHPIWESLPNCELRPRTAISQVLQGISEYFLSRDHNVLQSYFNLVVGTEKESRDFLEVFCHYSPRQLGLSRLDDEDTAKWMFERMNTRETRDSASVRWVALDRGSALWFNRNMCARNAPFFPVNRSADDLVKSGVCLPVESMTGNGHIVKGVVSIDSEEEMLTWTSEEIEVLHRAVQKIEWIISSAKVQGSLFGFPSGSQFTFRNFLEGVLEITKADWAELVVDVSGLKKVGLHIEESKEGLSTRWWSKDRESNGDLTSTNSTKIQMKSIEGERTYNFELKSGSVRVAELSCGNGAKEFAKLHAHPRRGEIFSLWSRVALGVSSHWKLNLRDLKEADGLHLWVPASDRIEWHESFVNTFVNDFRPFSATSR